MCNRNPSPVNLSGWQFTQGIEYTFPEGSVLEAGGHLVLSENPATLQTVFSAASLGPYRGRLANDGEKLVLRDQQDGIVDEVEYGGEFPWPLEGGSGGSIELIHPALDNNLGGSWRASTNGDPSGESPWEQVVFIDHNDRNWRYKKGTSPPPGGDRIQFSVFTECSAKAVEANFCRGVEAGRFQRVYWARIP